jgi:hypothetical protein
MSEAMGEWPYKLCSLTLGVSFIEWKSLKEL